MASRQYKRDKNGRFAGSGSAVSTTTGRAGGFANSQHRSKVQTQAAAARANASKGQAAPRGIRGNPAARAAVRSAVVRYGTRATVPLVATAVLTGVSARSRYGKAGRLATRNAKLAKRAAEADALQKLLLGKRPVLARPGGGGSKSGRPTKRYATSTIRGQSTRLRASNVIRAARGRN